MFTNICGAFYAIAPQAGPLKPVITGNLVLTSRMLQECLTELFTLWMQIQAACRQHMIICRLC